MGHITVQHPGKNWVNPATKQRRRLLFVAAFFLAAIVLGSALFVWWDFFQKTENEDWLLLYYSLLIGSPACLVGGVAYLYRFLSQHELLHKHSWKW